MRLRIQNILKMFGPPANVTGLLFSAGPTVPTATTAGYATGCVFQHTDGGVGTAFYVNEGSVTSCDFASVAGLTAAQEALVDSISLTQGAPATIADGDTAITAANLQAKILTMASSTAGRAPTVPTGTAVNAIVDTGNYIDWYFLNTGNQTVTISAATGHTLVGTMALTTLTQGHFRTRVSATNTAITYRIA